MGWAKREKAGKINRSRYEIMVEIMQVCLLPRAKAHIIYKGNLSFAQVNTYLNLLTSLGLLSKENGKYETTNKGRQFITAYKHLGEIIGMPASSLTSRRRSQALQRIQAANFALLE